MPLERNLIIHRNKDLSFCCPFAIRLLSFRDPILLQSFFPSFRRPFWAGACKGFFLPRAATFFAREAREKFSYSQEDSSPPHLFYILHGAVRNLSWAENVEKRIIFTKKPTFFSIIK